MATVKFTYALKRFYPDLQELNILATDVKAVVDEVETNYPGLKDYLLDDQGYLRKHVNIFVNGSLITDRKSLSDVVDKDAEVYIMQALSGG